MTCAVADCRNKCGIGAYRGFKFPLDEDLCKQWVTNCRRENWAPTRNSVLCQVHFETSQFTLNDRGIRVLKENAIPTIFESKYPQYARKRCTKSAGMKTSTPAECIEAIPSALVEAIIQSSSDSESLEDASVVPTDLPVPEPANGRVQLDNESNCKKSDIRSRVCYVCKNSGGDDVRFFSFPSNPKMLSLWASACNIDPDRVFPGDLLCSRHFRPEDIPYKNSERKRYVLKRTAVPIPINEMVVLDHDYSDSYSPDDPLGNDNQEASTSQLDSSTPQLPAIPVDCEPNNNLSAMKLDSIENVSCDVAANDVISENISEQKSTIWKRRRYIGEFEEEDMDNPKLAKLFYAMAVQEITKKRRTIHILQKEVLYLRKKLPRKRKSIEDSNPRKTRKKLPRKKTMNEDSDPDYEVITVTSPYD